MNYSANTNYSVPVIVPMPFLLFTLGKSVKFAPLFLLPQSKAAQNCLRESKCLTDCTKAPYFAPDNRSR